MDLYGWILEQISGKEKLARYAEAEWWEPWVLRRCAADRKLLTIHKPRHVDWAPGEAYRHDPYVCEGCGQEGYCQDWVTEHANDCPVLLAVAEGYGLTPEILAGLDRPKRERPEPAEQSVLGRVVAEMWKTAAHASLRASLVPNDAFVLSAEPEPSPEKKALQILEPELRRLPLYQAPDDA